MKKSAKPIYCQNDVIEIIDPLTVKRIGYPLGIDEAKSIVKATHKDDINALLAKVGLPTANREVAESFGLDLGDSPAFDSVLSQLAYHYVRAKDFGGDERTIHTELREYLRGKQCRVLSKRNVKTGTYYAPSGGYSGYYGEYEYEPGGLTNCKTHVILECQ